MSIYRLVCNTDTQLTASFIYYVLFFHMFQWMQFRNKIMKEKKIKIGCVVLAVDPNTWDV